MFYITYYQLYVCVYIYIYIHMCVYIYIYIYRERERERERDVCICIHIYIYRHTITTQTTQAMFDQADVDCSDTISREERAHYSVLYGCMLYLYHDMI